MATHKNFDKVCCVVLALCLALTALYMNGESLGLQAAAREMGYESRLFDTASVHTIDIVMEDWKGFLETAQREEYSLCSLVIDGETYENVAIRGKGNTSLTQVEQYGNSRYSFKVEFDHYDTALVNYPIDTPVSGGTVDSRPMLAWIFSSEEYTQLYHQYFSQFLAEWLDSGAFAQAFQQVVDLITPPMWRKTPPSSAPQRNSRRGWRPWRTSACCEPKASKASWRAPSPPRTTGRARTAPAWWTPPRWTSPPWAP